MEMQPPRTKRQRRRIVIDNFDKYLISLHREQRKLWYLRRTLGWKPVKPPTQKGWKRSFILREDVARSVYAVFFQGILDKINTVQKCHRKDFMKKRSRGQKNWKAEIQQLKQPDQVEFKKLGFCKEEASYFVQDYRVEAFSNKIKLFYRFTEPWRFVTQIKPNMIEQEWRISPEIEARMKWIEQYLESNDYEKKVNKIMGEHGRFRYHFQRPPAEGKLKGIPTHQALDKIRRANE